MSDTPVNDPPHIADADLPADAVEAPDALPASAFEDEIPNVSVPLPGEDAELAYPTAIPTEEELADASPIQHGSMPLTHLTKPELEALQEQRIAQIGLDRFIMQVAVTNSYENLLWFNINNYSAEAARAQDAIAAIKDKKLFSHRLEKDGKVILQSGSFRTSRPTENKSVSGEAGILAMMSTRKGQLRRTPLYNSGITLDIRVPTDDALHGLLRRARADLAEYGHEFGSHFYAYADYILKRAFYDFMVGTALGCSLKDWKDPGQLAQRLKLPDYDVVMTTIASLMYPEGYPGFQHICTRPADAEHPNGCRHITSVNADLTQLIHTNFAALNDKAVAHIVKARLGIEASTTRALNAYQEELGFDGSIVEFEEFRFTMTVPSMADYFSAGEVFNADLINEIAANNRKEIYDAISFREGRLYLPWIKSMAVVNEDESASTVTEDKSVISYMLDTISSRDPDRRLNDEFTKFINRSKLSHICYPTFACESCGYEPPTESGFLTVDPQHAFFMQSTQKLNRR